MHTQTGNELIKAVRQVRTNPVLWVALLLAVPLMAQPSLRIAAPSADAVVRPGQIVTVKVEAIGAFQEVMLGGTAGVPLIGIKKKPPYEFQFQLPADLSPSRYYFTACGYETPGNPIYSPRVAIIVERAEAPVKLRVEPERFDLLLGTTERFLMIAGEYSDGETLNLLESTLLSLRSTHPAVAKVRRDGAVTGVAAGSTKIIVAYRDLKLEIPVVVSRKRRP